MKEYLELLNYVLNNGTIKSNRTGINTRSVFGYHYKINLNAGFPLLTTKKINWKNILIENLWFLSGSSSWDFLHKHGVTFWDEWNEGNGHLPKAYGEYWRKYPYLDVLMVGPWSAESLDPEPEDLVFDQFSAIVEGLKKDPNNRRLVLTNWYPPLAWDAKLPPCHLLAIFNTQYNKEGSPRLCLHMTQRSCDVPVGVPYNLAGYAFLLQLVAHLTNLQVGEFSHVLVDAHIYENQIAAVQEQLTREPKQLPLLHISNIKSLDDVDDLIKNGTTQQILDCFKIVGYDPDPFIKMPVAV